MNDFPRRFGYSLLSLVCASALFGAPKGHAYAAERGTQPATDNPSATLSDDPQRLAEEGNPEAQFSLAQAYLYGMGIEPDLALARHWLQKSADQGYGLAQVELAQLLENDRSGHADLAGARQLYRTAALGGESSAATRAGAMARSGLGGPRDLTEARTLLTQAAKRNDARAQLQLAFLALDEGHPEEAFQWLTQASSQLEAARRLNGLLRQQQQAGRSLAPRDLAELWRHEAEAGSAEGMVRWGSALDWGLGVTPHPTRAVALFRKAAEAGHVPAMHLLAESMRTAKRAAEHDGMLQWERKAADRGYAPAQLIMASFDALDQARQLAWLRKAATQGAPEAQAALGQHLYYADTTRAEGRQWLLKAAAQGHAAAAYTLAQSGQLGFSVGTYALDEDPARWTRFAAERGIPKAQRKLAMHLLEKAGNQDEAVAWLEKAAAARDNDAASTLAELYRSGKHLPRDLTLAARWTLRHVELSGDYAVYGLAHLLTLDEALSLPYAEIVPVLARMATKGNQVAAVALATLRLKGRGVPRDPDAALVAFRQAADSGNSTAMVAIGRMYAEGDGVVRDEPSAVRWFERAIEKDDTQAKIQLARLVRDGRGVKQDIARAIALLEEAGQRDLGEGSAELGLMYERGLGVPIDLAKAKTYFEQAASDNWLPAREHLQDFVWVEGKLKVVDGRRFVAERRQRADAGDASAQCDLGVSLLEAQDESRDVATGIAWLIKAARQQHPAAARRLGQIYENGLAVKRGNDWPTEYVDPIASAGWFRQAAALGDLDAQLALAGITNYRLKSEPNEVFHWTLKAAEQGQPEAQLRVADLYARGVGTPVNSEQAKRWALAASAQGRAAGYSQMADMYAHGYGVQKDPAEALRWRLKAAEAGDRDAAMRLGEMYEHGDGVALSLAEAIRWYKRGTSAYDSDGAFAVARLYHLGPPSIRNPAEALRWYLTAIDYWEEGGDGTEKFATDEFAGFGAQYKGLAEAQLALARRFELGQGLEQSFSEALRWYRRVTALDEHSPATALVAWFKVADLLTGRPGLPGNSGEALAAYLKGAEQMPEATHNPFDVLAELGENWEFDRAFPAVALALSRAAKQGDPAAQRQWSSVLAQGRGVPRHDALAAHWRSRALASGRPAVDLDSARRAAQDAKDEPGRLEALTLFKLATGPILAKVDHPGDIATVLGKPKANATLLPALKALDKAMKAARIGPYLPPRSNDDFNIVMVVMPAKPLTTAELKDYARQEGISLAHATYFWETGRLVARASLTRSLAERVQSLRRAAALGSPSGLGELGRLYEAGLGVPKDFVQACMFYNLAIALGEASFEEPLARLGKRMTLAQRAKSQDLALSWWEKRHHVNVRPRTFA